MAKVITYDGNIKIGAYMLPNRKKPCLCVEKNGCITCYGTFIDVENADNFMNELGTFLGAKFESEVQEDE